jgi:hypothetical protein
MIHTHAFIYFLVAKGAVDKHDGEIGLCPNTIRGRNIFFVEINAYYNDKLPPKRIDLLTDSDKHSMSQSDSDSIIDKNIKQNIRRFVIVENDMGNQVLLQQLLDFYTEELFALAFDDCHSFLKHLSNDLNKIEAFGRENDVLILGDRPSDVNEEEIVKLLRSEYNFRGHIIYMTNDVPTQLQANVKVINTHEDGISKLIYKPYVSSLVERAISGNYCSLLS